MLLAALLGGCGGVLDPRGPVGASEKLILIDSVAIMLCIVVPVILATLGFAWWFRASHKSARYLPDWSFSGHLELLIWAIPALVITFLGGIAWFGSQALDPYKALSSQVKPIEIDVVSLDWKWLFIYPAEGIATVNQLIVPTGTPLHFRLTSSGVMNSFFIPQLGSQIYTMAGMTSQLNLQADVAGDYHGQSSQFSGAGFADMGFTVRAVSADDYARWIDAAKAQQSPLDAVRLAALAAPSQNSPPITYNAVDPGLFEAIVDGTAQRAPAPAAPAPGAAANPDRSAPEVN
jgi:cytochrome o ubiquinol oxidase subunit II